MENGVADAHGGERERWTLALGIVATVVLLDQLTKLWAVRRLADGPISIVGDSIDFRLTRNPGAAFSIFRSGTPILAVLAVVVAIFLVRAMRSTTDRLTLVALALVFGGAVGNLIDRVFRAPGFLSGHVVDFVRVGSFPVFNVADSSITIGAILLVIATLRAEARRARSA